MAGRSASRTIRVAVCGLTSSTFAGLSGQGAGKSCLCNRFIRPNKDDLRLEQTNVLNHSDFGSNIINNTHFLYWGEKVLGLEDGQDVVFQIIEHTEFVDDSSLKPFPSTKPYHKRCTQLKLQSGGKITYIEPDQLALPEEYNNVGNFPDKFLVDGFILCADVSSSFTEPGSQQKEIFDRLLQNLLPTKKPIVVALTKFDRAKDASVASVNEVLAHCKKQLLVVEVSALKGVNVDLCFLVLAHLVDPKKPKSRIIPYSEGKAHLDDRIRKNEVSFQQVLDQKITDFTMSVPAACEVVSSQVEFQLLQELCGTERVHKLVAGKLGYLKRERVEVWQAKYFEALPGMLDLLLPELPLTTDEESCRQLIKENPKMGDFLVEVSNWREDIKFLKNADGHVPFSLLSEDVGEEILHKHIDKVLKEARQNVARQKIHDALQNASGLTPGLNMDELFGELGVSEEAGRVSPDQRVRLYQERMVVVELECVQALKELFLENIELFTTSSNQWDVLQRVETELKQSERYQRLEFRPDVRKSAVIKHIANLQWPDKGPYGQSPLLGPLKESAPSKEALHPPSLPGSEGLRWVLDPSDQSYNLAILGRTRDNALTLRSDFLNHLSGSGACEIEGQKYHLQLEVFHGEELDSLTGPDFTPQGAIAVATSMACIDWLEGLLARLWVPSGDDTPSYRGMPLVILALDTGISQGEGPPTDTPLFCRAKVLAHRLQCVLVADRPTVVPKRLVVSGVVPQLLSALMDSTTYCHAFLNSQLDKQEEGLNVAVCTLTGDPYTPSDLLDPLLRHQLVWFSEESCALFLGVTIEKIHRTCALTFHSSLNLSTVTSSVHLGFILPYSSQRPASLAVIRSIRQSLPNIPILVIAVETEGSHDKLLEEGRSLAEQWGAMFISTGQEDWDVGWTTEFFSKCWFSRFTSWNMQEMSDEVKQRIRKRRPQPLPNRPLPSHPGRLSDSQLLSPPIRHSIAIDQGVEAAMGREISSLPFSPTHHGSLPRSPSRGKYMQPPQSQKEEDPTYSNPLELSIGIEQKRTTLGRTKRGSFPDGLAIPVEETLEDSEYALVADHRLLGKTGSLTRQPRSPSTSPPPPPVSPPLTNGTGTVGGGDVYATVNDPPQNLRPPTPKRNGYDRLQQTDTPRGYDCLAPKEDPYASVNHPREAQQQEPVDQLYSVVDKPQPRNSRRKPPLKSPESQKPPLQLPQPPDQLYPVVNKPPNRRSRKSSLQSPESQKPPLRQPEPPDQLYSVVNKPPNPPSRRSSLRSPELQKPPLQRPEPPDQLYSVVNKPPNPRSRKSPLQSPELQKPPLQQPENPDQLYSVVNKPRRPPLQSPELQKPPLQQPENQDQLYSVVNKPRRPPLQSPELQKPPLQQPENPDQLYSVVNKPRRPPLQSPELQKPPLQQPENPDQLYSVVNKPRRPPLQSPELQKPPLQQPENPDQLYSVVNKPRRPPLQSPELQKPPLQQPEPQDQLYSVVNKPKVPQKPPLQQPEPQDQLYSVVNKPKSRTPPLRQQESPDQLYSVVNKPRNKPPPPVAPKPRDKPRRSPTPKGSNSTIPETPDGGATSPKPGSSPKPTRRWHSPKLWRKNRGGANKKSPPTGGRISPGGRTSPGGRISPEVDARAATLPKNVVLARDRAWSDSVHGDGESVGEKDLPTLPERRYSSSELGLEEAPPLPERLYSWSDVEDNDEEVLQSDDDLDDPATSLSLSDHQAIYASIRRLSTVRPGYGGIQAIYNVVNEVTRQSPAPPQSLSASSRAQDESSVYDTLDSVMQSMPRSPQSPPVPGQEQVSEAVLTSSTKDTPPGGLAGMHFTARQLKLIKQQQKLLEKLQKKAEREAERRRKQEAKQRRKEEEKEKGRRRGRKTRNKEPERKRYFGSALETVAGEDGIPAFVKKCTQLLEETGLKSEGLYRVSGKKEDCLALQQRVDEDSNLDLASAGYGENAISSTLKAFFKLLPDPLISNDIAAKILDINSLQLDAQQTKLQEMLGMLPHPNLCTLHFLLMHLNKVQAMHEVNRMTASNLAIVFWPTLMRPPLMDLADPSKQMGWQLAMTRLIERPDCVPLPQ